MDWIVTNWLVFAGLAVLAVLVLWLVLGRRKSVAPPREYTDVLSEGAGPAARNSALIDAPPAARVEVPQPVVPPPVSEAMAGVGEIVAAAAEREVEAAAPDAEDDLTRIKGVGPKLGAALKALGVTRYAQIAAWSEDDIRAIDAQLGSFAGRATRDRWVEQCRLLAAGDAGAYEAQFGKM